MRGSPARAGIDPVLVGYIAYGSPERGSFFLYSEISGFPRTRGDRPSHLEKCLEAIRNLWVPPHARG